MCCFLTFCKWFYSFFVFQAKAIGTAGYPGQFSGYDEYVPMVDKAVDAGWKKSPQKLYISKGMLLNVQNLFAAIYLYDAVILAV